MKCDYDYFYLKEYGLLHLRFCSNIYLTYPCAPSVLGLSSNEPAASCWDSKSGSAVMAPYILRIRL